MPYYLAITIGPIEKTMLQARKTRELWSVSFTFSRLMKYLLDEFSVCGSLLSPNNITSRPLHGAGIYPDRCFIKLTGNYLKQQQVDHYKKNALDNFSGETGIVSGLEYYQIYVVQAEFASNPIGGLNKMLDAVELQQQYHPYKVLDWNQYWNNSDTSKSKKFFQELYKIGYDSKDELLPMLIIDNKEKIRRFPSIPEISTHELAVKNKEKYWGKLGYQGIETWSGELFFEQLKQNALTNELDDDDKIIEAIKDAFPGDFLSRHKYFSIVQADGDNVGKLIKTIEQQNGSIDGFSRALNNFADKAADLLVRFGAFPVYIGGDDLLFFAPLSTNAENDSFIFNGQVHGNIFGTNLFFLLSRLNKVFKEMLEPVTSLYKDLLPVSLSFGVMSGYYKHPMSEIQKTAYDLLKHDAKEQPCKNYISMKIQKHSGQAFHLGFTQQGALYESFLALTVAGKDKEAGFLNSVMYKLDDQKQVIQQIVPNQSRFTCFFKENFNETVHKSYEPFFKAVQELISLVFAEYAAMSLNSKMEKIYSALRFIHFLNAKDVNE